MGQGNRDIQQAFGGQVRARIDGADVLARGEALPFVTAAIAEAGSLYAYAAAHPDREALRGRGVLYAVPGPNEERWIVRRLTHGGILAPITADRFLRVGRPRPFNEAILSIRLQRLGIATPTVMAGVVYGSGILYRGEVARQAVENACDLAACLFGANRKDLSGRSRALAAAGQLVGRAHEAGLAHPDLNLRNVLIQSAGAGPWRAYLLDLEKCRLREHLPRRMRARMLARLRRSVSRFEERTGERLAEGEWQAFQDAYAQSRAQGSTA